MSLSRRHFLRRLGISLGLPSLESAAPLTSAFAGALLKPGGTPEGRPLRMASLYVPNGVNVARWKPAGIGENYLLSPRLEPLAPFRDAFQVISGWEQRHGWPNGDGVGDHARARATILTGARPKKLRARISGWAFRWTNSRPGTSVA